MKHGVPAILSFILPGLGQLVKGEGLRGIAIIGLYLFSILLMFVGFGLITTPIIWVWSIMDAYNR